MSPCRAGSLSLTAALVLALAPGAAVRADAAWKPLDVPHVALYTQPKAEAEMFADLNAARRSEGLAPLRLDSALSELARSYAREMLADAFIGHEAPDGSTPASRMRDAGIGFRRMGENLSYTSGGENDAFANLMNSPPHRRAMLDDQFVRVGIGAVSVSVYGTMYVQEFVND